MISVDKCQLCQLKYVDNCIILLNDYEFERKKVRNLKSFISSVVLYVCKVRVFLN